MKRIRGAIFPVASIHAERIFKDNKDVFVKYTSFKLAEYMKIIFYVSKEKKLVGEGRIHKVVTSQPSCILQTYKERLFINEQEFAGYTTVSSIGCGSKRAMSLITALELIDLKVYRRAIEVPKGIPPSGRYFTSQDYYALRELLK